MQFRWHPDESPPRIEGHSKAKLTVLRRYIRAYFDRLNVNPHRETFKLDLVDGFSGGGTFLDNGHLISGTPLIMLEEIEAAKRRLNQNRNKPLEFDCKCYFVDVEQAHINHLQKVLSEQNHAIKDSSIIVRNNAFELEIDNILKEIQRRQPRAGRAIFLIDQTGFYQLELAIVRRIFDNLPAAEVILTFAADSLINHLANTPQLIKAVAPLNLTESQIHDLIQLKNGAGGRALVQRTLRAHLRAITGATFDTPFYIQPRESRRALWFLHLSRHPTARDVMIRLHWEIQNTFEHYGRGDFGMLGWDALKPDTFSLFHFEQLEIQQMNEQLLETMPAKLYGLASQEPVTVDAIRHVLGNDTAARFSDLDEVILRLAKEREIQILSSTGAVRSQALTRLQPTDQIAFPDTLLLPGISRIRQR